MSTTKRVVLGNIEFEIDITNLVHSTHNVDAMDWEDLVDDLHEIQYVALAWVEDTCGVRISLPGSNFDFARKTYHRVVRDIEEILDNYTRDGQGRRLSMIK